MNPSPSSDGSAIHCANNLIAFCDTRVEQSNNMWSYPSPESSDSLFSSYFNWDLSSFNEVGKSNNMWGYPSPESSNSLFSSYFNRDLSSFNEVGNGVPVTPGGHFDASLSSTPVDFQSLNFNFSPLSFGENLCPGRLPHGCCQIDSLVGSSGYSLPSQSSVDAEHPVTSHLGVVARSKDSQTKVTRLARKKRIKRKREASFSSLQLDNGDAFAARALLTSALLTGESIGLHSSEHPTSQYLIKGKSSSLHSSGSLRSTSSGSSGSHGSCKPQPPAYTITDLQFLLLKVLRPSDLSKLGRIVLSKKDAERHLPRLDAKEGVQFPCEDYDTGEIMMLRYRFWPNNKSRMYLFENTGHFIRTHHLREYDKMLLYRNKESGSYVMLADKAQDCLDGFQILNQHSMEERLGEAQDDLQTLQ